MARKRFIAPEFFTHGELYDAEARSGLPLRIAFAGLWTQCDCRGCFRWRPRELKLAILPYDNIDFGEVLDALAGAGFVEHYVVDGKEYGRIPSLPGWQHFHPSEKPARDIPEPPEVKSKPGKNITKPGKDQPRPGKNGADQPAFNTAFNTASTSNHPPVDTGRSEKTAAENYPAEFELTWNAYPKRAGANGKRPAYRAWRARMDSGASVQALHDGTLRFNAYCVATGKVGTEYVMQAARFFGPDAHFAETWELPAAEARAVPSRAAEEFWTLCKRYGFLHCTRDTLDGELARAHDAGDLPDPAVFKAQLRRLDIPFLRSAQSDRAAVSAIAERLSA